MIAFWPSCRERAGRASMRSGTTRSGMPRCPEIVIARRAAHGTIAEQSTLGSDAGCQPPGKPLEDTMMKSFIGAASILALLSPPAFAVGANCGDQLAQLKAQLSSAQPAQSQEAKKYQQAEQLCSSGKEEEAQALAREIREEMAKKSMSGSSTGPARAGVDTRAAPGSTK